MLAPLQFSPLVRGQEEVQMANRKPQLYCTTRGMRLELWPGALPRSRDYKNFHLLISEPEPVLNMGKTWAAPEGNRVHFAPCLHASFNKGPTYWPGLCPFWDLITPQIPDPHFPKCTSIPFPTPVLGLPRPTRTTPERV